MNQPNYPIKKSESTGKKAFCVGACGILCNPNHFKNGLCDKCTREGKPGLTQLNKK